MASALSWVTGSREPPLLETTIGQALELAAHRWGDADALISCAQFVRWTWKELDDRTNALAAGLLSMGFSSGERIGIWSPNCAEWTLLQFAAARIGLILTTVNPAYKVAELEFTLKEAGMKGIVAAERFKSSDYLSMIEAAHAPQLQYLIKLGGAGRKGWQSFDEISSLGGPGDRERVREIGARLDRNDPINIQFTSGTTGLPKGATLSHRNILNNGRYVGLVQQLGPGDRICVPVPLYHCFGMVMGNLAAATCGAAVVYPSAGFDAESTLKSVENERCTALYGVPTMFIAQLAHPGFDRFDLSSLRTGVMAGSVCPIEVMNQVFQKMHMTGVTIAYGMTETSPVSFQSAPDDPVERRVTTIGRVQPHVEVKVIDANGQPTLRGTPGEICTRGYSVMLGYWGDQRRTAEVIDSEGWMHTGDLGTIDEQGYGKVVGRIKDVVIRGGENVYPQEIEAFLYSYPKVNDAQVVGVPDARMGEELCAWIRLAQGQSCTEQEIQEFCRGRIAHYKIPRYIRFVEEFPLTASGKVQKYLMRQQMIQELSLFVDATA